MGRHNRKRSGSTAHGLTAVLVLLAGSVAWPRSVYADEHAGAALTWERGDGAGTCIGERELRNAVEAHLSRRVFTGNAGRAETAVHGAVLRDETTGRFSVSLKVQRHAGVEPERRDVSSAERDCRRLDEALVLVLALLLDDVATPPAEVDVETTRQDDTDFSGADEVPDTQSDGEELVRRPPPPAEEPRRERSGEVLPPAKADAFRTRPRPEPPTRSARAAVADREAEPAADGGTRFEAAAGPALAVGLMPAAAAGVTLGFGVELSTLPVLELAVGLWPVGSRPTDAGDVTFLALNAELRVCPRLWKGLLRVDMCAGAALGVMRVSSSGFDRESGSSSRALLGVLSALRASAPIGGSAFVRASAGVHAPLLRDRFVLETGDGTRVELHRLAPLTASFELQAGVSFR